MGTDHALEELQYLFLFSLGMNLFMKNGFIYALSANRCISFLNIASRDVRREKYDFGKNLEAILASAFDGYEPIVRRVQYPACNGKILG